VKELRMAEQLLDALSGDFEPEAFRDEYQERLLELVEAKAEGKTVEMKRFRRKPARDEDLTGALSQSLAAAREEAA
jgi:DNA end-binding protein Ku